MPSAYDYISLIPKPTKKYHEGQVDPATGATYSGGMWGFPTLPTRPTRTNSGLGSGWLKANPQAQYQQAISGLSMPMQNWFGPRYGTFYNEYMAELAKQAQTGALPTMQFGDFLAGIDWINRYYSNSPYQRGSNPSRLAPRTRWLNY